MPDLPDFEKLTPIEILEWVETIPPVSSPDDFDTMLGPEVSDLINLKFTNFLNDAHKLAHEHDKEVAYAYLLSCKAFPMQMVLLPGIVAEVLVGLAWLIAEAKWGITIPEGNSNGSIDKCSADGSGDS